MSTDFEPVVTLRSGERPIERLDPRDRGFTLGDGLFESLRVREGEPEFLDEHLARMDAGATRLGIPLPIEIEDWVAEALDLADDRIGDEEPLEAALRITVSRGATLALAAGRSSGLAGPELDDAEPTTLIEVRPFTPDPRWYEEGVVAITLPWAWEPGPLAGIKTTSWGGQVAAHRWARAQGADEGLWPDGNGCWVESTTSNLFVVDQGVLRTPPLESGCLPGITRAQLIERFRRDDRPVDDRTPLDPHIFERAEEIFLTNSLRGVVPVAEVLSSDEEEE